MFLTRDFEILDLSEKEGFQRVAFKFIQFPHILVAVRIQCQRRQTKWRNYYTYGVRKFFLLILKSSSFFRAFTSSLKVLTLKKRFLTITPYSPPQDEGHPILCVYVWSTVYHFLVNSLLHIVKLPLLEWKFYKTEISISFWQICVFYIEKKSLNITKDSPQIC